MKPKARYNPRGQLWTVYDGVSFVNGFSVHPSLELAYICYLELRAIIAYQQQGFKVNFIGRYGQSLKMSFEDFTSETK